MDLRILAGTAWEATREFLGYSWKVQKKAARDTTEYLAKHHLWWEVLLAMGAALVVGFTGPWEGVERIIAALIGALAAVAFAVILHWLARLIVAPALLHRELETELFAHSPRKVTEAPRGFIDFEYDVNENVSMGKMTRLTEKLAKEAKSMTECISKRAPTIEWGKPRAKLRAAKYLARKMTASARRVRGIHSKFVEAAGHFEDTYTNYSPIILANAPPEQREKLLKSMRSSLESVTGYRDSVSGLRKAFQGDTKRLQQDLWVACELSDEVYKHLEATLGKVVGVMRKISSPLGSSSNMSKSGDRRRKKRSKKA